MLPGGAALTVEAFQSLGRMLGTSTGGDDLHYLIEDPFAAGGLSDAFLHAVAQQLSFAAGPLYAVLHEPSSGSFVTYALRELRGDDVREIRRSLRTEASTI